MEPGTLIRPDARISYWDEGPRDAPMVLFLHGAGLDHRAWDPQTRALSDRYRVVTMDLRHHGESSARGGFRFDDAVADVLELLEHLRAEHVAVVGLSLGGNIAQELVRRAPERVDALVLADTTCNAAPRPGLQKEAGIAAIRSLAWYPRPLFLQLAARVTADDPAARDYVRDATASMPQGDVVRVLTSLLGAGLRPDPEYQLPVPTLILHGDHDRLGDIALDSGHWARTQARAEHAVVPAASHLSNLDAPEAFTERLASFLDRHLPPRPPGAPAPTTPGPAPRSDETERPRTRALSRHLPWPWLRSVRARTRGGPTRWGRCAGARRGRSGSARSGTPRAGRARGWLRRSARR